MTAPDLLARAQSTGVQLWRDGSQLRYHGEAVNVDSLLPDIARFKPQLLELLGTSAASQLPQRDINSARRRLLPGLSRLMCDKDALELARKLDLLDGGFDIQ